MKEPKQVILMRTDLKMPKGKMVAQGAHASMAVLTQHFEIGTISKWLKARIFPETWMYSWLCGSFTKICLAVSSDIELAKLYSLATAAGIPAAKIIDNGRTCFNGVPTLTCCAIGPWDSDEIDKITGHLKLL